MISAARPRRMPRARRGKFRRRQFEIPAHIVAEGGHQDRGEIVARLGDGSTQARHIVIFEVQRGARGPRW